MQHTINNDVYKETGDIWWDPDQVLNLLHTSVNPGRVGYFKRIIEQQLKLPAAKMTALEVGCGGGILCEEIARMGFTTTGLDPSEPALQVARAHSQKSNLKINYVHGTGEKLPFPDASFDVIFCCDVLEHVSDLGRVVSEISRVLKPGGHLFYDTLNRTPISNLVAIKIWQDWKPFAFMPKNLHVWSMFIKPQELEKTFANHSLEHKQNVGLAPNMNPLKMIYLLRQRVRGKITVRDLGRKFRLIESKDKTILYAGHAVKTAN
ncbi:MAG: bifunctional 2-polyprenyl-6-hydroxyphenol methylase/3-demethylubiquinol 3-O-methyltransferase UbiG [Bdellovibrionia bacterium]